MIQKYSEFLRTFYNLVTTKYRILSLSLLAMVLTIFQNPAPGQLWDAATYLDGSLALVSGGDVYNSGGLSTRGVLTPLIYSPTAFMNQIFTNGQLSELLFTGVLVEGAVFAVLISVLLLPRLRSTLFGANPLSSLLVSMLSYFAIRGFAPYSLMDLCAVSTLLAGISLLDKPSNGRFIASGLFLGVSINLRPSYLLIAIAIILASLICGRLSGFFALVGFFVSQVPQLVLNFKTGRKISFLPLDILDTINFTAFSISGFVLRIDSIVYSPRPKGKLHCDPTMVSFVLNEMPSNYGDLFVLYASHPLDSGWFLLQKLGATLLWPVSVPYFEARPVANALFGSITLLVTVIGISRLVLGRNNVGSNNLTKLSVWFVVFGTILNFASNATESRYALPLVLMGVIGISEFLSEFTTLVGLRSRLKSNSTAVISITLICALLLFAGFLGLRNSDSCPTEESFKRALMIP